MPNHWSNKVVFTQTVTPKLSQFLKMWAANKVELCQAMIPMPEILRHTVSGGRRFTLADGREVRVKAWWTDATSPFSGKDTERMFTPEESAELRRIGHDNWYDWAVKHWGTKWGTYNATYDSKTRTMSFKSAWALPNSRVFELLYKRFGVSFVLYGHDEGNRLPYRIVGLFPNTQEVL